MKLWRRDCSDDKSRHDWTLVVTPVGNGQTELLGVTCDRCGGYYGYRSPFNDHLTARKLGDLARRA